MVLRVTCCDSIEQRRFSFSLCLYSVLESECCSCPAGFSRKTLSHFVTTQKNPGNSFWQSSTPWKTVVVVVWPGGSTLLKIYMHL